MSVKALVGAVVLCIIGIGTTGTASATPPRDVNLNVYNVHNSGADAGNDSLVELDRSFNLARGDGSPGSDIINEVSGASSGMSPKSTTGSLTGSSTQLTPAESHDE